MKLFRIIMISSVFLCELSIASGNQKNWTGIYGGINAGGVFNNVVLDAHHPGFVGLTGSCSQDTKFSSFFSGLQSGYMHTLVSNILLGIEGDVSYNADQTGKIQCTCPFTPGVSDKFRMKNRAQGSIKGRLGYAIKPDILPYIALGGSFADTGLQYRNEAGDYYKANKTQSAFLAGAGLEWKFSPFWSVRVEYGYMDYRYFDMQIPDVYGLLDKDGNARAGLRNSNVKFAMNYWF